MTLHIAYYDFVVRQLQQLLLEDTLCSRVQLRILKLLAESQALTTSEIAAKVGVNYLSAKGHLEALERSGVLTRVSFGKRIRFYKYKESVRANAVRRMIEVWGCPENSVSSD